MPRYIIERNVGTISQEDLETTSKKSKEVMATIPGMVWIRSYYSAAEGKIYCEYEAPNPKVILEHARLTGLPADKISEITLEISPDMFP